MATFTNNGEGAFGAWVRLKAVDFELVAGSRVSTGENSVGMFTQGGGSTGWRFRISSTNGNNEIVGGDASQYIDAWVPVVYTANGSTMEVLVDDPVTSVASGSTPATAGGDLNQKFALGGTTDFGGDIIDMDIPWFSTTGVTTTQVQEWVDNTRKFFP
jgi:hypothetical protein